MAEVKTIKRKIIRANIRTCEEIISGTEADRSHYDRQESQLKSQIADLENEIQNAESRMDSEKTAITTRSEQQIVAQQQKIDATRKEKTAAEKEINDMMAQISGLSIFARSLKKELTKKIEDLQGQISTMTSNIREQEKVCEDIKRTRDLDVSALEKALDDNKSKLGQKNVALNKILDKVKKNEQQLESEKANLEKLKTELAEVEKLL